jgi:hypothetical protein
MATMLEEVTKVLLNNIKKNTVDYFDVKDNVLFDVAQRAQCGMEFVITSQYHSSHLLRIESPFCPFYKPNI